jgi:osmotically inducible protein OsmC
MKMVFSRHADIDWKGNIQEGGGDVKAGSGAFTLAASFPRRIGAPEGKTSPEELMAAAHASCYGMALAGALGRKGGATAVTHIKCTITADKSDAGIKITTSRLDVVAEGLTGIDKNAFVEVAKAAGESCPVSGALKGSLQIEVHASVK